MDAQAACHRLPTITLFSNLVFKGVGRHPKTGRKKGVIKVHTVIHANEGVPSDIRYTSAATHYSFMLRPESLSEGDIMAMDRACLDYGKLEEMTRRGVVYVTKMKKGLKYRVLDDTAYQTPNGLTEMRIRKVVFRGRSTGRTFLHEARTVTYFDEEKRKAVTLLTNDEKRTHKSVELLRTGHYGQNHTDVLR